MEDNKKTPAAAQPVQPASGSAGRTPELSTHLLAMGEKVKVLEPEELKSEIKNRLLATIQNYE